MKISTPKVCATSCESCKLQHSHTAYRILDTHATFGTSTLKKQNNQEVRIGRCWRICGACESVWCLGVLPLSQTISIQSQCRTIFANSMVAFQKVWRNAASTRQGKLKLTWSVKKSSKIWNIFLDYIILVRGSYAEEQEQDRTGMGGCSIQTCWDLPSNHYLVLAFSWPERGAVS